MKGSIKCVWQAGRGEEVWGAPGGTPEAAVRLKGGIKCLCMAGRERCMFLIWSQSQRFGVDMTHPRERSAHLLQDGPPEHEGDEVGIADGGEAVCHHNTGATDLGGGRRCAGEGG